MKPLLTIFIDEEHGNKVTLMMSEHLSFDDLANSTAVLIGKVIEASPNTPSATVQRLLEITQDHFGAQHAIGKVTQDAIDAAFGRKDTP